MIAVLGQAPRPLSNSSTRNNLLMIDQIKQDEKEFGPHSLVNRVEGFVDKSFEKLASNREFQKTIKSLNSLRFEKGLFIGTHRQSAILNVDSDFIKPSNFIKMSTSKNNAPDISNLKKHYTTLIQTCLVELHLEDERAETEKPFLGQLYIELKGKKHTDDSSHRVAYRRETSGQRSAKKELCKAIVKAGIVDDFQKELGFKDDPTIQHYLQRYSTTPKLKSAPLSDQKSYKKSHQIKLDLNPIKLPFSIAGSVLQQPFLGARSHIQNKWLNNPYELKSIKNILNALEATTYNIEKLKDLRYSLQQPKTHSSASTEINPSRNEKTNQKKLQASKERKLKAIDSKLKEAQKQQEALQYRLFKLTNPSQYDKSRAENGLVKSHRINGREIFSGHEKADQIGKKSVEEKRKHEAEERVQLFTPFTNNINNLANDLNKLLPPNNKKIQNSSAKLFLAQQYSAVLIEAAEDNSSQFHPEINELLGNFKKIAFSNQRGELFSMIHGLLDEIQSHHVNSGTNITNPKEFKAVQKYIKDLKLLKGNSPQDILIQKMFDGKNGQLNRGSQRHLHNEIHNMTEALPKILGILFAYRDELGESTFKINDGLIENYKHNFDKTLDEFNFEELTITPDTKEKQEELQKAQEDLINRLGKALKYSQVRDYRSKSVEMAKLFQERANQSDFDKTTTINDIFRLSVIKNLNKFASTSVHSSQLDHFFFDGIDNPVKQSMMPLYNALRGTDASKMELLQLAYTQNINPMSKVYFNTWAKAMVISQQLGSIHFFHSPYWLAGPPVFNIADMVNTGITSVGVAALAISLALAIDKAKKETINDLIDHKIDSRDFDEIIGNIKNFEKKDEKLFLPENKSQVKNPARPMEDRVFKTIGHVARLKFEVASDYKHMHVKTIDRRTPTRFKDVDGYIKPKGLSYKPLITQVKHSTMLHNMKVETLPLGRMALTETIDLVFVKPVKVVKALYDDAYGKNSMRSWEKPAGEGNTSDQTDTSTDTDGTTSRSSVELGSIIDSPRPNSLESNRTYFTVTDDLQSSTQDNNSVNTSSDHVGSSNLELVNKYLSPNEQTEILKKIDNTIKNDYTLLSHNNWSEELNKKISELNALYNTALEPKFQNNESNIERYAKIKLELIDDIPEFSTKEVINENLKLLAANQFKLETLHKKLSALQESIKNSITPYFDHENDEHLRNNIKRLELALNSVEDQIFNNKEIHEKVEKHLAQ